MVQMAGIDPAEGDLARRGFPLSTPDKTATLEAAAKAFLTGYQQALALPDLDQWHREMTQSLSPALLLFAIEGAGMAGVVDDAFPKGDGQRVAQLFRRYGQTHGLLLAVGMGNALARMPTRDGARDQLLAHRALARSLPRPLRGFLADGWGYQAIFGLGADLVAGPPAALPTGDRRSWDQGAGRALWFVEGAEPARLLARLATLPGPRRADVATGAALAACFAGGADPADLRDWRAEAEALTPPLALDLALGATLASLIPRQARMGHPALAQRVDALTGLSPESLTPLAPLPDATGLRARLWPGHHRWRAGIRRRLAAAHRPSALPSDA